MIHLLENWSDDDSDVICIDSPEKDNEKNVVKKVVLTRNDDSDDCVILEDESIDNQCESIDTPPAPDCKSFEDFKSDGDKLVTSTPKHNSEDELREEKSDASESSDDDFEIVGDNAVSVNVSPIKEPQDDMMLKNSTYSEQCSDTVDVGKSTLQPQPSVAVSTETKLPLAKEKKQQ